MIRGEVRACCVFRFDRRVCVQVTAAIRTSMTSGSSSNVSPQAICRPSGQLINRRREPMIKPIIARQISNPTLSGKIVRQLGNSEASERLRRRGISVAQAGSLLPRGKTVWLEDSVHDVPLQRPELVAGIINEHVTAGYFS